MKFTAVIASLVLGLTSTILAIPVASESDNGLTTVMAAHETGVALNGCANWPWKGSDKACTRNSTSTTPPSVLILPRETEAAHDGCANWPWKGSDKACTRNSTSTAPPSLVVAKVRATTTVDNACPNWPWKANGEPCDSVTTMAAPTSTSSGGLAKPEGNSPQCPIGAEDCDSGSLENEKPIIDPCKNDPTCVNGEPPHH